MTDGSRNLCAGSSIDSIVAESTKMANKSPVSARRVSVTRYCEMTVRKDRSFTGDIPSICSIQVMLLDSWFRIVLINPQVERLRLAIASGFRIGNARTRKVPARAGCPVHEKGYLVCRCIDRACASWLG